jgi:hypothetical protein
MTTKRFRWAICELAAGGLLIGMMTGLVANPVSAKTPNAKTTIEITAPENTTGSYSISGTGSNKQGTASSSVQGQLQLSKASIKKWKPASASLTAKAITSTSDPGTANFGPITFKGTNISGSIGGTVSPPGPKATFDLSIRVECRYSSTTGWVWTIYIDWFRNNA